MTLLHRRNIMVLVWLAAFAIVAVGGDSAALAAKARAKTSKRAAARAKVAKSKRVVVKERTVALGKGTVRVSVPSAIIPGSMVGGQRTFLSTMLKENSLASIRLGRRYTNVLKRWGNPTRITVGGQSAPAAATAGPTGVMGAGMPGGIPGGPGMMGPGGMLGGPGMMGPGGMPGGPGMMGPGGMPGPPTGFGGPPVTGGVAPGGPGMMMPGGPGMMPGMGTAAATPTVNAALNVEEVTWTYDLPNGITIEFIISEGDVSQITVGGIGPWGDSKTHMGLQLGDTYKLLLWVAGYPEKQEYAGRFLRVFYTSRNGVLFTLDNKKIVGITMASNPDEMVNP